MKWHELYGRHEVEWTIQKTGDTLRVDLFRLGHILWVTQGERDQTKVCHAVSSVCEITSEAQVGRFYRYLSVVNSVRGQRKTTAILEMCRLKVGEMREERTRVSLSTRNRQLELELGS
jgi:hypothetical protein